MHWIAIGTVVVFLLFSLCAGGPASVLRFVSGVGCLVVVVVSVGVVLYWVVVCNGGAK
jgi:hypothetical protein